jgi:hypothetical protein
MYPVCMDLHQADHSSEAFAVAEPLQSSDAFADAAPTVSACCESLARIWGPVIDQLTAATLNSVAH